MNSKRKEEEHTVELNIISCLLTLIKDWEYRRRTSLALDTYSHMTQKKHSDRKTSRAGRAFNVV